MNKHMKRLGPPPGLVDEPLPLQITIPIFLMMVIAPIWFIYLALTTDPSSPGAGIFKVMGWFGGFVGGLFWTNVIYTFFQMRKEQRELEEYRKELAALIKRHEPTKLKIIK